LSNANKNVFQSTNNLESEFNPKPQINQRPFFKQALRSRSRDYTLMTRIKSKTCKIYKKRLSITENQSNASFKLINQSITGIRSPSQEIEAKLGKKKKKKIASLQQFLQESSQADSGAQCYELRSSQATNRAQCNIDALFFISKVRCQRVIASCLYSTM
jgi:hypothetical protein